MTDKKKEQRDLQLYLLGVVVGILAFEGNSIFASNLPIMWRILIGCLSAIIVIVIGERYGESI